MKSSAKPVKPLEGLVRKKIFLFPVHVGNTLHDGEKCIQMQVNGVVHFIPVGVEVTLTNQEFAVLRDMGIILNHRTYAKDGEFDPVGTRYDSKSP